MKMRKMNGKKILAFVVSLMLFVVSIPITPIKAASVITVDCASVIRGVTHCANGSLYGITENTPGDYKNLVDALHPFVMRNPARGSWGNQHPFGDAIKAAKRLSQTPGALVSIDLADILPGWPYKWPGMQSWLNQVGSFINDKKASGLKNWYGYEIWNEPGGTWKDSNGMSFEEMWKQTYQFIRRNDPNEKIIGPCYSWYNENRLRSFLQYCKANNCLPDIMSWHELSGIEGVSSHLRSYRNLERSLGIKELPISINEYCDAEHSLEGQPGSSARFIGKFERYKVESAMISWWFVPNPGRLGSLLATDTQKGAGWYFYKWYGDMTGNMVNVIPPNDNSKYVDGAACVDSNKQYISFIFGGPNDGNIRANIKNIPTFIGNKAKVKVEKVDWVSKDTVCYGTKTIQEKTYNVTNGQITVDVSGTNASSGYRIYITKDGSGSTGEVQPTNPVSNLVTSGATYKLINKNSQKALGVSSDSTADGADVIQWTDNGKTSQQWIITEETSGYKLINVNAKKALDVTNNSMEDGGDIILWRDNGQANQRWYIEDAGDGYVTIENVNSGKLVDVERGGTSDGANVLQWASNNGANQQWKLVRVDGVAPTPTPTNTATPTAQPTKTPEPTQGTSSECALSVSAKGDSWDGGYNMNITLSNVSSKNIANWKLELNTSDVTMNSIWCAQKSVSGTTLVVTPESYNAAIASNASTSFGFGGDGTMPNPLKYKISYEMDGKWVSFQGTAK